MPKPLFSCLYRAENTTTSRAENANASLPFRTAENVAVAVENAAVCCCYAAVAAVVAAITAVDAAVTC